MVLSWGKCQVSLTPVEGTNATESAATIKNIVDGSAQLTTTQGDKTEAKIEGGEVEAVRYSRNTYELTFQERLGVGKIQPSIKGDDGVVAGEWTCVLTPEAEGAPAFTFTRSTINVQVSYTSADGAIVTYTVSALKPENGQQITWSAGGGITGK